MLFLWFLHSSKCTWHKTFVEHWKKKIKFRYHTTFVTTRQKCVSYFFRLLMLKTKLFLYDFHICVNAFHFRSAKNLSKSLWCCSLTETSCFSFLFVFFFCLCCLFNVIDSRWKVLLKNIATQFYFSFSFFFWLIFLAVFFVDYIFWFT